MIFKNRFDLERISKNTSWSTALKHVKLVIPENGEKEGYQFKYVDDENLIRHLENED
ncbi:hypothetical protein K1728_00775 [Weissella confusa]|uniref:hypothetical protein n=1 Tax=Weissella confusa TaxID=1583 RepID=UPI001C6F8AD6|nr:hypothetical protein [Weissella confusa]QYU57979.1 hypothetical protein K1728_00775 [Weissella confusa]